jgi:GNAT superfamily N-acetyltransferase
VTPRALEIVVDDDPPAEDIAALDARLDESIHDATGRRAVQPVAVFARDATGDLLGGVHGWCWGACCELVSLWVDERERGSGLGRKLLQTAEDAASARGCRQLVLFTHSREIPSLYLRANYDVVAVIDDYPEGMRAYWLRKSLS